MGSTQSTWGLFDPRLSPDLHPPARDRRTSDQPYIESKPAPHMKASSAIIAALLASSVVAQASALGEGVEWFGAGQQSLGQLQALQGFWNQSPKGVRRGLVEPSGGQGRRGLRRLAPQVRGRKEAPSRREHRGTWEEPGAVWPGPVRHRLCQGRQE